MTCRMCDCADPTAMDGLADECDCDCHSTDKTYKIVRFVFDGDNEAVSVV